MKKSKTVYLDTLNKWVTILFLTQIYLFATQGYTNLLKGLTWFAVSQFGLAAGLAIFLLTYYLLNYNCGNKYIYFDETGVEFKHRYFESKSFLHWENVSRISFGRRKVFIQLKDSEQKWIYIKCPYEKFQEIKENFIEFVEPMNIIIEQRK